MMQTIYRWDRSQQDDLQIFFFSKKNLFFFVTFALFRVSVPKRPAVSQRPAYGQYDGQNDAGKNVSEALLVA